MIADSSFEAYRIDDTSFTHIENTMVVEGSDGRRYTISCTASFRWSKCVWLHVGESFQAAINKDGMTVNYHDSCWRVQVAIFQVVAGSQNHRDQWRAVIAGSTLTDLDLTIVCPGDRAGLITLLLLF